MVSPAGLVVAAELDSLDDPLSVGMSLEGGRQGIGARLGSRSGRGLHSDRGIAHLVLASLRRSGAIAGARVCHAVCRGNTLEEGNGPADVLR